MNDPGRLEAPPSPAQARRERRGTLVWIALMGGVLVGAGFTARRLARPAPEPVGPVQHGPLPAEVRAQVLALLEPHLEGAELLEGTSPLGRTFVVKGRPRALLARDFHAAFRPLVARQLMPLLAPHGEELAFQVAALDLPPVRLRPSLPKE